MDRNGLPRACQCCRYTHLRGTVDHTSVMARTWSHVHAAIDEHGLRLLERRLFWMSSHTSEATLDTRTKKNALGWELPVTPLDWRANRLADGYAKFALKDYRLDNASKRSLEAQITVLQDALILIGMATYAANNTKFTRTEADGQVISWHRDTTALRPRKFAGILKRVRKVRTKDPERFQRLVTRMTASSWLQSSAALGANVPSFSWLTRLWLQPCVIE